MWHRELGGRTEAGEAPVEAGRQLLAGLPQGRRREWPLFAAGRLQALQLPLDFAAGLLQARTVGVPDLGNLLQDFRQAGHPAAVRFRQVSGGKKWFFIRSEN